MRILIWRARNKTWNTQTIPAILYIIYMQKHVSVKSTVICAASSRQPLPPWTMLENRSTTVNTRYLESQSSLESMKIHRPMLGATDFNHRPAASRFTHASWVTSVPRHRLMLKLDETLRLMDRWDDSRCCQTDCRHVTIENVTPHDEKRRICITIERSGVPITSEDTSNWCKKGTTSLQRTIFTSELTNITPSQYQYRVKNPLLFECYSMHGHRLYKPIQQYIEVSCLKRREDF